jgi:hypothetical protein
MTNPISIELLLATPGRIPLCSVIKRRTMGCASWRGPKGVIASGMTVNVVTAAQAGQAVRLRRLPLRS